MTDPDRLKQLLEEARQAVEKMEDWMKTQEPSPGQSYKDWIRHQDLGHAKAKDHCE